jgi:hypothetical protein
MQGLQKIKCASCGTMFMSETETQTCPSCSEQSHSHQEHGAGGCGCGHWIFFTYSTSRQGSQFVSVRGLCNLICWICRRLVKNSSLNAWLKLGTPITNQHIRFFAATFLALLNSDRVSATYLVPETCWATRIFFHHLLLRTYNSC